MPRESGILPRGQQQQLPRFTDLAAANDADKAMCRRHTHTDERTENGPPSVRRTYLPTCHPELVRPADQPHIYILLLLLLGRH